jgi:hypothetical protein
MFVRLVTCLVKDEPDVFDVCGDNPWLLDVLLRTRDVLTCRAQPIHTAVENGTNKMVTL